MRRLFVLATLTCLALPGCDKGGETTGGPEAPEKKAEPEPFEPGEMVEKKLEGVRATVKVPDNLEMKAEGSKVTFTAEGFPTLIVEREDRKDGNFGALLSAGTSGVRREIGTPENLWRCSVAKPGQHGELLKKICTSLKPEPNPRLTGVTCREAEGFDEAKVKAAFEGQKAAIEKCFAEQAAQDANYAGGRWNFNLRKSGNSTNFAHTTGNSAVMKCLGEVAGEIRKADAMKPEGDAKLSCNVTFIAY